MVSPPVSRFVFTSRANQRRVSLHPPPPVDVCHNILILNRVTDQPCVRIIRRYSVAVYIRAYCKSTRRGTWPRVNTSNRGETKERMLSRVRARKDETRARRRSARHPLAQFHCGEMWNTNYSEKSLFPASVFHHSPAHAVPMNSPNNSELGKLTRVSLDADESR